MSAHTPGPWMWADKFQGLFGAGPENDVLTFYHYEGMHLADAAHDKGRANAALMAAAPELLQALLDLVEHHTMLIENEFSKGTAASWMPKNVAAAIARATGRTP